MGRMGRIGGRFREPSFVQLFACSIAEGVCESRKDYSGDFFSWNIYQENLDVLLGLLKSNYDYTIFFFGISIV